ncbi:MAG: hypothetical protein RLY16_1997 [Bacteroidota bacterium]
MKKTICLLLLCLGFIQLNAQNAEEAAVKDAFNQYKQAILADEGENAANFVDIKTIQYYDSILIAIRNADSVQINQMPIMDKLMVLIVRHRANREAILNFNGRKLFVYAVEKGMVGKSSVAANSIGKVTLNKNQATGQLLVNGTETPVNFMFYKEEGVWKVNLTSIFPMGSMALKQMIDESGEDENAYILKLLGMITGNEPSKDIWKPL